MRDLGLERIFRFSEIEMTDVDEIIYFIKSLKKGFDKDLFQSKIDELAYAVDTNGLAYEDFHTLFKVWLNLSIREYLLHRIPIDLLLVLYLAYLNLFI